MTDGVSASIDRMDPEDGQWPPDGLERVDRCPVCGGRERRLLYEELTDRVFFCAPSAWRLHRCESCGSAYLDPRPTPDTVHLAYRSYYTHTAARTVLDQEPARGLARVRQTLVNGYWNWRFGTRLEPASALGIPLVACLPVRRIQYEQPFRHLPRRYGDGRLLDLGCGDAGFLEVARSLGWRVQGADPDPQAVALARKRGIDVRRGGMEAFAGDRDIFDVITMSHVIEHVHEPWDVLRAAYRLLRPGGVLWLETPNLHSRGHERYGRHWRGLEPPRHLVLFHWRSLEQLLRGVGYRHIRRLPRYANYAHVAAQSEAIAAGRDPNARSTSRPRPRIPLSLPDILVPRRPPRSEYVTLQAYKPQE